MYTLKTNNFKHVRIYLEEAEGKTKIHVKVNMK